MSLCDFAKAELQRAGLFDKTSDYGGMMGETVLKMVEHFADEGHSGTSAHMAIQLFEKLVRYEPISPLTGADDEWTDIGHGTFQNNRCPRVFKDSDGRAYDIEGYVFEDPDGCRWTNGESRRFVTFPYTPTTEIVKRYP